MMAFGQRVSDYKYVFVPEKFLTFKNSYNLENLLSKALNGKKYVVVRGDRSKWPTELITNSCNVINADVLNDKSLLRNRVILQFKDCNDKVILESKGSSIIKEFEEGFSDALKQALIKIPVSNPVENNLPVQVQNTTKNDLSDNISISSEVGTGKYSNGKLEVQKVQIDNDQFILVRPNSSVPYATFKTTTKRDVFRVKLESGDSTIGYFEDGNIIVEIPQTNGEYSKEIFSKK